MFENYPLKTTVMVSVGVTMDGLSKGNVCPCGFCSLSAKANYVQCGKYGKWIHSRCAGVNRLTQQFPRNIAA